MERRRVRNRIRRTRRGRNSRGAFLGQTAEPAPKMQMAKLVVKKSKVMG